MKRLNPVTLLQVACSYKMQKNRVGKNKNKQEYDKIVCFFRFVQQLLRSNFIAKDLK